MNPIFFFFLDQTLLNFHASEEKALEIISKKYGLAYTKDTYSHFKDYNKSLWLELEKGIISRTDLFRLRFTDFIAQCKGESLGLDPLAINKEFIGTMAENGVLMDGALEFVRKLKSTIAGCRIYIISNGATVNAKGRINSTGLNAFLDGIFVSEEMGIAKPAKEFFDRVLSSIGAKKEECIVIGDSLITVKDHFLFLSVEADRLPALHPVDFVESLEILLNKTKALNSSLSGQILVKDAAGIDVLVLGDQYDLTFFIEPAQFSDRIDAGRGGADDDIFFTHTTSPPRA